MTNQEPLTNHRVLQDFYDGLIRLSNGCYENAQNPALIQCGLHQEWIGKSQAYDFAAVNFAVVMALNYIQIETTISKRMKDLDEAQHELQVEELENEKNFIGEE